MVMQETEDRRQETEDRKWETGNAWETEYRRREAVDVRQEM